MNSFKLALGAMLAAGLSAAVPATTHAQYPGQYGGQYGGYGAQGGQNSALAEQRRQVKEAELEVLRLRQDMSKMKSGIEARYETKEEWETAKANLKKAEDTYEQARKRALLKLYSTPEYKAAKDKQLKSEQAIQSIQASGRSNDAALEKAQSDRWDSGLALRNMETTALKGDPKIEELKAQVDEARKAWEALQDEVKEALAQDPEYLAAQQQLEQAQANVEQMKMALAQQAAADREARRAAAEAQRGSRGSRPSRGGGGGYGGGYGR